MPVIVISAMDDLDSAVRCIEMGAEDYLPKPFDAVLLRARLNACLTRKRLYDTVQQQADELESLNRDLAERVAAQVGQLERLGRLRRFLPSQLAELIVSSGHEDFLEPHRRKIAVLFCDLRGFTAFSETADPEEVMAVLEEFHGLFGLMVRRYEATVGGFGGDSVMVFFNDPVPCDNAAAQAVCLAVDLRHEMAELCDRWRKRDIELDFGVGIALGYASLGQVGFEGRYDYTPIGPVVNLAARLCDHARTHPGTILLDQLAFAALEELVDVEPIGPLALKGFTRTRSVYRVVGLRASPANDSTTALPADG
jgi:class 3 adenylate cyclase